jgi:hypothetical protein
MQNPSSVLFVFAVLGACGGVGDDERPTTPPPPPVAYEEARARLDALTRERIRVAETDDVESLLVEARRLATEAAEETVEIARLFDEAVRDGGERYRARSLVGIAAANRALAVLIRDIDYAIPRDVEARLEALEDESEAGLARDEIRRTFAEALEERAAPLDQNECTALRGAVAALDEQPDPDVDRAGLRERMSELPDCQ